MPRSNIQIIEEKTKRKTEKKPVIKYNNDSFYLSFKYNDLYEGLPVEFDITNKKGRNCCEMVRLYVPLPEPIRKFLMNNTPDNPGLAFDKYAYRWNDQQSSLLTLKKVKQINNDTANWKWFKEWQKRRNFLLDNIESSEKFRWKQKLITPLSIQLSRITALENANICFHPIYGFVYIPGSSLKGMARAWAENVWLDSLPADKKKSEMKLIRRIFGWSEKSAEEKKQKIEVEEPEESIGSVIFHDAWPLKYPSILIDIANSHHSEYYAEQEGGCSMPPGDWEDPNPVYFLALDAKQDLYFDFAISAESRQTKNAELRGAKDFLKGALLQLGAGAKTNAGYGIFEASSDEKTIEIPDVDYFIEFNTILKLVTPAFLAGADPSNEEDCDLRSSTLKGLLRYWWRTLHSHEIKVATLRKLEESIWGSTKQSGAVHIDVIPGENEPPTIFKKGKTMDYLAFGMYKMGDEGIDRYVHQSKSYWNVRIMARESSFEIRNEKEEVKKSCEISAQKIMKQVKAALWLLCRFGGVGSRNRKGFGSLEDLKVKEINSIEDCLSIAKNLRTYLSGKNIISEWKKDKIKYDGEIGVSPDLKKKIYNDAIIRKTSDWEALKTINDAYKHTIEDMRKDKKFNRYIVSLGLPREIGNADKPKKPVKDRHPSPLHIHVANDRNQQNYIIRLLALIAPKLPDEKNNEKFLKGFINEMKKKLKQGK